MLVSQRGIIAGAMILVGVVFVGSSLLMDYNLRQNLENLQIANHRKLSGVVKQSLDTYFRRVEYFTEYAADSPAFKQEDTTKEDSLRFQEVKRDKANELRKEFDIDKLIIRRNASFESEDPNRDFVSSWQIFKGLPLQDENGNLIAARRRILAREALRVFQGLHYFFELDPNGDIVFLEPFDTQKNIESFNYNFRDYLRGVMDKRRTVLSEGYISLDKERTQIITVATPVLDDLGNIKKVIAASISNVSLRENVFKPLREQITLPDETVFYLIDRHGHVVASSGPASYQPKDNVTSDNEDGGNIRDFGLLAGLGWNPDRFEKGSHMDRQTRSWDAAQLKLSYSGKYQNWNGIEVLGTLHPVSILTTDHKWGILIETPLSALNKGADELKRKLVLIGGFLGCTLVCLGWALIHPQKRLTQELVRREREIGDLSAKVAHDLRSPLETLQVLEQSMTTLPPNIQSLLSGATTRLRDISSNLQKGHSRESNATIGGQEEITLELIPSEIELVVSQKRFEYRSRMDLGIHFVMDSQAYGLFARIKRSDLDRTISNIINNSAEAIAGHGTIRLTVSAKDRNLEILICDDGPGIPPDRLSNLFTKGATFNKPDGRGLGLYLAKQTMTSFGGRIDISSTVGTGTTVKLTMPRAEAPGWFCEQIVLKKGAEIVIVDDDQTIHDVWDQRLNSLRDGLNLQVLHLSSPAELQTRSVPVVNNHQLYLVDYEFRNSESDGFTVIDSLRIASQSILVTSHDEEQEVRHRAIGLGIKVLPKTMAPYVPLIVE